MNKSSVSMLENVSTFAKEHFYDAAHVFLGFLYFSLLSQLKIPLNPVAITLHTFAIFTLALYQGKNKASCSILLFLASASMGLPVFPHLHSNPLWILEPTAGYYLSFPVAAYAIGYVSEKLTKQTAVGLALSIIAGQIVIYSVGVSWLSIFFGWEGALKVGLYPFMPMAAIKLGAAVSLKMTTNRLIPSSFF